MDKNVFFTEDDNFSSGNTLNLRDVVDKYISHWKWFAVALITCITITFFNLNFSRPKYQAEATIKIKDDKGGENSTLSAFQDLSIMAGSNENIEDEIEVLKSKYLIGEVLKALNFNVQLFTDKDNISKFLDDNLGFDTEFYETEKYKNPPLKINFLISDSALYRTRAKLIVTINSSNNFTIWNLEDKRKKRHAFGEKISREFGDIIITPNVDLAAEKYIGTNVLINISTIEDLTNSYLRRIQIEPKSDYSSVLGLVAKDILRSKAEDFLNALIRKYNERAINLKEELSKSTSDFVTKRLEIISDELSNVDLTAESIKSRFRISDVASETGLNMESSRALENQIVEKSTEIQKINAIKEYVSSKNDDDLIPIDVGVGDSNISSSMNQYNQLMLRKKKLLETSTEQNPIVVNLNEQLKALEGTIKSGLNNLESSQQISLDALNRQESLISSKLYSAPRQERQYRDVQRQQQIKEALYLYLLQKREETAITLGVSDPNAEIIDYARSAPRSIAPKKKLSYIMAILLGLIIPIVLIYAIDLLDSKIHSKEEVENHLNIPIIGDIPKTKSGSKKYLVKKDDYSSVAEAFRIIRTNLNFVLTKSNKESTGKVIFITSTIAGEGKSFVSSNLATVLAHADKKTLLIGMDIRAPKIKQYLGVKGKFGVTNFIVNTDLSPKDVIIEAPKIDHLDIISSGDLAPNPSELLMNQRVIELVDYAKENYDYVVVDTAAFSMVTDTMILSRLADMFIYVIRANYLDKRYLKYIKSLYLEKRLNNMTLLINDVDFKKVGNYGYGYGYGEEHRKSKKKKWKLI